MIASSVKISEETIKQHRLSQERIGKLNRRQLGKLRFQKLKDLEEKGELASASTRNELATLVGFQKGDKTGVSWVNNMIARGYVAEHLVGFENGKMRKEFHLTNKEPDYDFTRRVKAMRAGLERYNRVQQTAPVVNPQPIQKQEHNIQIEKGDLKITATLNGEDIVKVISAVLGVERN